MDWLKTVATAKRGNNIIAARPDETQPHHAEWEDLSTGVA
jgi:hypothetical protein